MPDSLQSLFEANSIAIVGVSDDPTKIGSVIFSNLRQEHFAGAIYPINPKYSTIFGHPSYPSLLEISTEIDVVCIAVPQPVVEQVIDDCIAKKVKNVVIITAGFAEVGNAGKELEERIAQKLKNADIRLLGPNCLGFIATHNNCNLSFAASTPKKGNIAFLSQSGAFCTALLDMAIPKNMGFSHLISIGNKADIAENELLRHLAQNPKVSVLGAYLEEIEDGRELLATYQNLAVKKPFILFKPGKSNEAQKAISSHTGSIAGSYQTFKTAVSQAGIILAPTIRATLSLLMAFSWLPLPKGDRIAIITNAGGPGIIATDTIIESGLHLASFTDVTKEQLKNSLPPTSSLHNPIDILGDALADRYQIALRAVTADENVDAVLLIVTPQLMTQIEDTAKLVVNTAKLVKKPIIPIFIGGKYVKNGLQRFFDNEIPAFVEISDAIETLKQLVMYSTNTPKLSPAIATKSTLASRLSAVTTSVPTVLSNSLTEELMNEFDIRLPPQKLVSSIDEALSFAQQYGTAVLKAPNEVITHKTDVKGLYLNLQNQDDITQAFNELQQNIAKATGKHPQSLLIQQQMKYKEELFIGANRDGDANVYNGSGKGFGHLLVFGKGGIYTEIYKDHGMVIVPANRQDFLSALASTKVVQILTGARGQKPLAVDQFITTLERLQQMLLSYPLISSFDINPLAITEKEVFALDVKIFCNH